MKLKVYFFRLIGILAFGMTLFFLLIILTYSTWDHFMEHVLNPGYVPTLYGFIASLITAAVFLSIEQGKSEKENGQLEKMLESNETEGA